MESQTFVIRQLLKFGLFQYKMPLVKLASKFIQLTDGLGYVVCLVGSPHNFLGLSFGLSYVYIFKAFIHEHKSV